MARVPRIDSPCPLSMAEQRRIDGHCGRCNKRVHALDGLDDAERHALFAAAKGPLCVSYRVPVNRAPALGAAMAVMLSAGAAMAGQECIETAPAYQSIESEPASLLGGVEVLHESPVKGDRLDELFVGGVAMPEDAQWVDDGGLPDLPIIIEQEPAAVANEVHSVMVKPRLL